MAGLKSLAKDTAIYGLSSIVGRFLNYLLVPIYAAAMSAASGGYGVVTEVYAWTALLMVILTYGMETTFFRFVNKETENSERVYSTVLFMVGSTSLVFAALCMLFLHPVAGMMGYGDHPWYIGMMALVIAMDAFQCIPFAYRAEENTSELNSRIRLLLMLIIMNIKLVYFGVGMGSGGGGGVVVHPFYRRRGRGSCPSQPPTRSLGGGAPPPPPPVLLGV